MSYEIEFYRCTPAAPHGEPMAERLSGFASRRAARAMAERRRPHGAEGFRLYEGDKLLLIVPFERGASHDGAGGASTKRAT
jgi:hypothetical protein